MENCEFGEHVWKFKSRITNVETGETQQTDKCILCHDYHTYPDVNTTSTAVGLDDG